MAGSENRVLVYDVGGSHISAAVFDRDTCRLEGVVSAGYPSAADRRHVSERASFARVSLPKKVQPGICGASLAMPGPFDYDAGISWMEHKLPYLYGFDLRQALAGHLDLEPSGGSLSQ